MNEDLKARLFGKNLKKSWLFVLICALITGLAVFLVNQHFH